MEDDNALDIIKWMFKETTTVDLSGPLIQVENGESVEWEAKLRGNILAMKPVDAAVEPVLIVCEKIQVRKCGEDAKSFCLKYGDEEIVFSVPTERDVENWMLKLATSSHLQVQAELDQTMDKYYAQAHTSTSPEPVRSIEGSSQHYFLAAPYKREHTFSVYQSVSVPNRKIACTEIMFESKLSLVIPLDMVKLFIRWTSEMRDDLLGHLWAVRNGAIVEALHNAVRHCNSNIEIYTQSAEFLEAYVGPNFRPSCEKFRMAFAAVPINLHVQYFQLNNANIAHILTSGATAATPLRFANGGLHKIRRRFVDGLEPIGLDHTNEMRYYSRRATLLSAKRQIGELTRRIDVEWHVGAYGLVDKVGVQILAEIKQLHETIIDLINNFPNISNLVDSLCEGGFAQLRKSGVSDTLSNQLDSLDALLISLNSKMAVIDKVDDDTKGRGAFEESAKTALNSTLDVLLQLVESLLLAQLLSLVVAFRKAPDCQTFFHIQLRSDLLLSQAVTLVATALLTNLENVVAKPRYWSPLITYFSFLSCYGDERGMMEDMYDLWMNFPTFVQFRFVPLSSSVSQTCIPQIEGHRTDLKVSIPLQSHLLEKLPMSYAAGEYFRVRTLYWNIGINHEATLASSGLGDITLEENINLGSLAQMEVYVTALGSKCPNGDGVKEMLAELQKVVTACPSRKNVAIFPRVMALSTSLGGVNVLACKSGKDRTSMAVTLEEGRVLKENCGMSQQQTSEIIDCLRRDGVRRENCRKNVGKAIYSFSPFQMHFLPKPEGTFAQKVAS